MKKVLVIGEVLIDLVQNGDLFSCSVGGAPFNVAYNVASLGQEVDFLGQCGDDYFGSLIEKAIRDKEKLCSLLEIRKDLNTTIALNVEEDKKREYFFIRKNTADYQYNLEKLEKLDLSKYCLVHLGSLFLSEVSSTNKLKLFVERCIQEKIPISFDVNFRKDIFSGNENVIEKYQYFIDRATIIKMSEEEVELFYPGVSLNELCTKHTDKILIITKGDRGSVLIKDKKIYEQTSYRIKPIDTVGAGDSLLSGFIFKYLKLNESETSDKDYFEVLKFASACAAMTCSHKGALKGYESEKEVNTFIENYTNKKRFLFFKY